MADIKVTGLTALTSLSTDDLLMIVDDPGGTPASKKMTAANFIAGVQANTDIDDLNNVTIAGASSGDVLKYNGSGWVNDTDTSYSDEQAQDAIGTILVDSSTVDFTYNDATPSITASVIDGSITTTKLGGDITTAGKALLDDSDNVAQLVTLGLTATAAEINQLDGVTLGTMASETAADYYTAAEVDAGFQPLATVLTNTTASFTTTLETKLNGIETGADVTDATNVAAAGALMDSEVASLSGIKSLTVPDSTTISTYTQGLLDNTSAGAWQTDLGLVPGTNVQAYDAELAALAGLTSAADKMPYFTGSGTAATATLTSTARNLLDDTSEGAMRTTLSAATTSQTDACFAGFIETPSDKTYKLVVKAPHAGTITECTTISASGTCTATFKINTTALGGTANSVSSSEQSQSHSSSNVFSAGDDIQLTVSSNSSCTDMSFTIKYTRTLA